MLLYGLPHHISRENQKRGYMVEWFVKIFLKKWKKGLLMVDLVVGFVVEWWGREEGGEKWKR